MNIRKDNTPFRRQRAGGGLGIATLGAWIAGLALAALVVSPAVLHAAVIDDFDGEQPGWTGWNPPAAPSDPAALAELVSHRLRFATQFTTATDPANPMGHFCDVYYSTDIPVQQGKTLVLKSGLVSVGPINIFASLAATDAAGGKYMFLWGRTEVALLKWSQSAGFSVAFWETHAAAYHDLVLALEITPDSDDLLIRASVTYGSGAAAYQRTVRDTPASDWGVPDPLPHGWQIFGPDVGAPYKGDLKVVGLGVLHDTDGQQGTAIAQFDNIEYRTILPTETYVIDDFENGRKFMRWGLDRQCDWEIVDGQLKVTYESYQLFIYEYETVYELAEGQPVEFSLDLVSASASDAYAVLWVLFPGPPLTKYSDRGYGIYVLHDRVGLSKIWDEMNDGYVDSSLPSNASPKTMSLTLTREGINLIVDAKVVLRDDPQQVLFSHRRIDSPGRETSTDPGPPPSGPVQTVMVGTGIFSSVYPTRSVVVDNLVSSQEPQPLVLGIRQSGPTEATLVLPRRDIALESDSVLGPWRPCPEPVVLGDGQYTCMIPLSAARYFRMVRGFHIFDTFEGGGWPWQTASVVPGTTARPSWSVQTAQSRGRILGGGVLNADFTLRWGAGIWYRDCVGTVDILDWGDAMEDATFGILLRAVPETELWYSNTAGLPEDRYAGLLTFKKADNPAESALSITGPGGELLREQRFAAVNPDKEYRLRFWAVGDQLTLELFDKENLDAPIQTITATDGRIAEGMDGLYGTKSAGGTYEVWIDQYMMNGTTVY